MATGGIASIKERDNFDEDGATMKLSEEKEFKKFLKGEKIKLVKQFYRSSAAYRMLVINLGCISQGVDAKYLMSRKRKNLMQIARNSMTLLCDFSTRSTNKGKSGGVERAMNDLVCCFEYMLSILRLEYRIQNYMHSQKFPSNQILLIKTGLPVHAPSDKKFGIKYLVVKNFELSTWIQKDIKELEDMIESSRNTSLVKPWDIEPGLTCRIHSAYIHLFSQRGKSSQTSITTYSGWTPWKKHEEKIDHHRQSAVNTCHCFGNFFVSYALTNYNFYKIMVKYLSHNIKENNLTGSYCGLTFIQHSPSVHDARQQC